MNRREFLESASAAGVLLGSERQTHAHDINLLDEHMRRFNAAVPMLAQWDNHEVMNNWHPGLTLDANARCREIRHLDHRRRERPPDR